MKPNAISLPFGDSGYHPSVVILGMSWSLPDYRKLGDLNGNMMINHLIWYILSLLIGGFYHKELGSRFEKVGFEVVLTNIGIQTKQTAYTCSKLEAFVLIGTCIVCIAW